MKGLIFCLIFFTTVFGNIEYGDSIFDQDHDNTLGNWVVKYKERKLNPYVQTLLYCHTPGCNDVYEGTQESIFFKSKEDALSWINQNDKEIIGLYFLTEIPIAKVKRGKKVVKKDITVEEEVDNIIWE